MSLPELAPGKMKEIMKSKEEIQLLIKGVGQLKGLIKNFSELSKKKPDEQVNKFKLNLVNKILSILNSILDETNKPFKEFVEFDDTNLPSNSDVLIILNQYLNCMENFSNENTKYKSPFDKWIINGKLSDISADLDDIFKDKK